MLEQWDQLGRLSIQFYCVQVALFFFQFATLVYGYMGMVSLGLSTFVLLQGFHACYVRNTKFLLLFIILSLCWSILFTILLITLAIFVTFGTYKSDHLEYPNLFLSYKTSANWDIVFFSFGITLIVLRVITVMFAVKIRSHLVKKVGIDWIGNLDESDSEARSSVATPLDFRVTGEQYSFSIGEQSSFSLSTDSSTFSNCSTTSMTNTEGGSTPSVPRT
eukprot:CAMPEP_0201487796 /NCGR_PEP_ID=MMETSP0151_2-20130828/15300_1 /ASSEMBLY_ACC=CAM_ASM_000257 /TAXON_ID=200890 /ORGANISM="Paramoeba atlantica, Strain 621/1 / CCAP 1560/9" /LENGTH=218 /DNA_ID=CAMNT_0047872945 /DNA_START=24 /DNA_END=680 /DNA_ORIENTATION=-